MSDQFARDHMKVAVAKMLQTIGWNTIHKTPLDILTDLAIRLVVQVSKSTHDYANEFGCIDPNLDHLGLAFRECHISLNELKEYVTYVNFAQPPTPVPKFPIPREDNLNFLKPGSKEVVTRPVHIHEHLPPMLQINEAVENDEADVPVVNAEEKDEEINVETATPVFKRPAEVSPGEFKRPRCAMEEEGRPTREISSVMMTTSGYISPAREGKLPESRNPLPPEPPQLPPPPAPTLPAALPHALLGTTASSSLISPGVSNPKPAKMLKKMEKKKEKFGKELFKPLPEERPKKVTTMKDVVKLKQMKAANLNGSGGISGGASSSANNFVISNEVKVPPTLPVGHKVVTGNKSGNKGGSATSTSSGSKAAATGNKVNKALAAARLKTERLNTTITPIPMKQSPVVDIVDKLFTEPDKKKVNILKKISNVKNEKLEHKITKIKEEEPKAKESRECSPDLIIDEPDSKMHISNDITIELINSVATNKTPDKPSDRYFDDDSPPGTPSTPKTPEMISTQSPPIIKEKRKRKDKSKIKKVQKVVASPVIVEPDSSMEMDRPRTPEAPQIIKKEPVQIHPAPTMPIFPYFQQMGPGLIPTLPNPLFHGMQPGFGQAAYMHPVHPGMPINFMHPLKREAPEPPEPRPKSPIDRKSNIAPLLCEDVALPPVKVEKKSKEHKKEKKDKLKKKNKKDKLKNKAEKKKLKEEKKDKLKKEKKEKRKDKEVRETLEIGIPKLTLKLGTPSPRPETPDSKKLNIRPVVVKKEDVEEKPHTSRIPDEIKREVKREMSPELAKISALVTGQPKPKLTPPAPALPSSSSTSSVSSKDDVKQETVLISPQRANGPGRPRIHPIKPQKPHKQNKDKLKEPVKDSEGNEVWICPACGRQDDGSPMIGCDDCDAWYHWVCVGIQVPPDDNEDWYCRLCIVKKQEVHGDSSKKKKRKKRERKEHN